MRSVYQHRSERKGRTTLRKKTTTTITEKSQPTLRSRGDLAHLADWYFEIRSHNHPSGFITSSFTTSDATCLQRRPENQRAPPPPAGERLSLTIPTTTAVVRVHRSSSRKRRKISHQSQPRPNGHEVARRRIQMLQLRPSRQRLQQGGAPERQNPLSLRTSFHFCTMYTSYTQFGRPSYW